MNRETDTHDDNDVRGCFGEEEPPVDHANDMQNREGHIQEARKEPVGRETDGPSAKETARVRGSLGRYRKGGSIGRGTWGANLFDTKIAD